MLRKLNVAAWNNNRTWLLAKGTVRIEGAEASFHSARFAPPWIYEAMIRQRAYDASELGMTSYANA